MTSRLNCFLINLDRSAERLASVERCFSGRPPFRRVIGTDGKQLNDAVSIGYSLEMNRKEYGRLLTKGEIGCYHSHLNAVKCFLKTGDPFGVILEDDALVDDRFFDFLNAFSKVMSSLPTDLRVVNICNSAEASNCLETTVRFQDSRFKLFRTLKFPTVARGLVYSRLGASELLTHGSTISKPFDHFLKDWLTRRVGGYCLSTPIVGSAGFSSDIGSGTSRKEQPFWEGLRYDWVVAKRDTLNDYHRLKRKFLKKE